MAAGLYAPRGVEMAYKKGETKKLVSEPKHPYTVSTLFAEFVVDLYTIHVLLK